MSSSAHCARRFVPPPEALRPGFWARLRGSQYWRDILLQASGNTAAQALGIAAMPLLTRLYAPADFAALNLFSQAVAMLTIVVTLRFEYLVMLPKDEVAARAIVRRVVVMGGTLTLAWTALIVWLPVGAYWVATQGALGDWLWLAPLTAWALSLSIALQQRVQRLGDFRTTAVAEFASRCAYVASSLLGAMALPNLVGLMAAPLAGASVKVRWLVVRLRGAPTPGKTSGELPSGLRRLALSTSFSAAVSIAAGFVTMVFIAEMYGAASLGQYGLVASTLYLPSTLLGQAIGQVYYQRASALQAEGRSFAPTLLATSRRLILAATLLFATIAAVAPWAYPLVFGSAWQEAGEIARWMCLAAAAGFVSTPIDRTSLIVNAWWYQTTWHGLRTITTLAALLYAARTEMTLQGCIVLLSVQTAVMYVLDWLASWRMSVWATRTVSGNAGGGAAP